MRLLVADDIGLVKQVNMTDESVAYLCNTSGADLAVVEMIWLNLECTRVAICRESGSIDVYELSTKKTSWSLIKSLEVDEMAISTCLMDEVLVVISEGSIYRISLADFSVSSSQLVGGPYTCVSPMKAFEVKLCIVATRDGSPPVLINLDKNEIMWTGKHANDTAIGLNSKFETTSLVGLSEGIFAAGDASGKLRFYDIPTQRKPVYELPVYQVFTLSNNYTGTSGMGVTRPISRLTFANSILFVGDTYGTVIGLDMAKALATPRLVSAEGKLGMKKHVDFCRKLFPMKCNLKGIMGSIRDIQITNSHAFVVSAGRFAYSFDLKCKKNTKKIFLKQKLTCCLFINEGIITDSSDVEEDSIEDSSDVEEDTFEGPLSKSKRRRMRKGCGLDN